MDRYYYYYCCCCCCCYFLYKNCYSEFLCVDLLFSPPIRLYTVRYREKGKDKKWVFQLCPATETVIDNLKPNTPYEFGVKDNAEDSIWSKTLNHKTVLSGKYLEIVNQKAADFESVFSCIRVLLRVSY